MKAEERHRLEQNALNRGLSTIADKARTGELLSTRTYIILAAVLLLSGAFGYWLYASREHDRATAKMWTELEHATGPAALEEFSKSAPDKLAGRIARLQLARVWLGPEGLQRLSSRDPDARKKAIESVEKAREQFLKLADEFKDDLTLQAQCVDAAAHAELALVGIPKDGSITEFRGTPDRAADLFNRYAKVVGETTKPGEEAKKKADEIVVKRQEVLQVAQAIHNKLTPPPTTGIELPKSPFDPKIGGTPPPAANTPKAPDTIPPPTVAPPPTGVPMTPAAPAPTPKAADPKAPTPPPPAPTPPVTKK